MRQRNERDALRVALAAGGTGGHITPALAVAEELERRRDCSILFFGSSRGSERRWRELVDYPVIELDVGALAGVGLRSRAATLARLPLAVAEAWRHLGDFGADLLIAAGGYACGPPAVAAWLRRVPVLALEQNARPGLTTRWLRHLAAVVAVSFPATIEDLGPRAVVTGNPVRARLPAATSREAERAPVRRGRTFHLLVLGGSQGAHGLNLMLERAIPHLANADIGLQILHQTGAADEQRLGSAYASHDVPATVTPFIHHVGEAYAWADLVCARAGATTIAELTYCGLPAILVPFPHASDRHQHANAAALVDSGAALLLEERTDGAEVARVILETARDRGRLARMAAQASAAGTPEAASRVADLALDLVARQASQRTAGRGSPRADEIVSSRERARC